MKRLLTLTAILCLLLVVMIAGCVVYGRTQPTTDVLGQYGITRCGTTWCLLGITLGSTSWAEALAISGQSDSNLSDEILVYLTSDGTVIATFYRTFDQTTIGLINIHFIDQRTVPTLGTLIERYGAPCVLDMEENRSTFLTFRYHSMAFNSQIYHANGPLGPPSDKPILAMQLPVDSITLSNNNSNDCGFWRVPQPNDQQIYSVAWRGFASEKNYITRAYSNVHYGK